MLCTSGFMDDVTLGCSGPHSDSDIATPGWSLMCVNALFVKDLRCHFCNDVKWCVYW